MIPEYYHMNIAGCERDLPLCPLNDELMIAGFIIVGDPEITTASAKKLLELVPEHDVIITAETKGIPLAHEMARLENAPKYIVARKGVKLYMKNVVEVKVQSITTAAEQHLYLDGADVEYMKGKKVLIVDDVISTGESLKAIETLVEKAGGEIVGRAAILAEGDAYKRDDINYIEVLPLFDKFGSPLD